MAMYELGFDREVARSDKGEKTRPDYESDDLAPARGVLNAVIISAMIWAIIIGIGCAVT